MSDALTTSEPIDPLWTTSQIAEMFSVKPETVADWIKTGKLEGVKFNGYWRVRRSEVIKFANSKYGA